MINNNPIASLNWSLFVDCPKHVTSIIAASFLVVGCTGPGYVDGPAQIVSCTDTRNGDGFTYNSKTIRNVRTGYAGANTTLELTDDHGVHRSLSTNMVWLKCTNMGEAK